MNYERNQKKFGIITKTKHRGVFACSRDGITLFYLVYSSVGANTQALLIYLKLISGAQPESLLQ